MPAGELVTVPLPVPARLTLSVLWVEVKVAVTLRVAFIVTLQVFPETESQPLQLAKVEFTSAVAVKVTMVPLEYVAEHVAPQLMPAGELVTAPVPVPLRVTFRACATAVNVAVTERAAVIETVQVFPEVESHPLQVVKVEPPAAVAVSVTDVPLVYEAEHVLGQVMPAGELETVPVPVPLGLTFRLKFVVPRRELIYAVLFALFPTPNVKPVAAPVAPVPSKSFML